MSKTTPKRKATKKTRASCPLIQWMRPEVPTDAKGRPVCPKCGEPAEMVVGVLGQACWAHK